MPHRILRHGFRPPVTERKERLGVMPISLLQDPRAWLPARTFGSVEKQRSTALPSGTRPGHLVATQVHAMIVLRSGFGTRNPKASSGRGTSSAPVTERPDGAAGMRDGGQQLPDPAGRRRNQRCGAIGAATENDLVEIVPFPAAKTAPGCVICQPRVGSIRHASGVTATLLAKRVDQRPHSVSQRLENRFPWRPCAFPGALRPPRFRTAAHIRQTSADTLPR